MRAMTRMYCDDNDLLRGINSPVFWGSFIGLLAGSILSGFSYLGYIGSIEHIVSSSIHGSQPRPVVVIFCCLLCIRYYASIVFLTYDDTASPRIRQLEANSRRAIFIIQFLLIVGCSLNIALLPVFGGVAATGVIVVQATLVCEYWRRLWGVLLAGKQESRFEIVIAISDFTILVSAIVFFIWEMNWMEYDETGAGMCMGAIIFIFVVECLTTYFDSLKKFLGLTISGLKSTQNCEAESDPALQK